MIACNSYLSRDALYYIPLLDKLPVQYNILRTCTNCLSSTEFCGKEYVPKSQCARTSFREPTPSVMQSEPYLTAPFFMHSSTHKQSHLDYLCTQLQFSRAHTQTHTHSHMRTHTHTHTHTHAHAHTHSHRMVIFSN